MTSCSVNHSVFLDCAIRLGSTDIRPTFMMPGDRKATGIRLEKNLKSFYKCCRIRDVIPDPDPIFYSGSRIQG
jgi:hypothetical protein